MSRYKLISNKFENRILIKSIFSTKHSKAAASQLRGLAPLFYLTWQLKYNQK